MTLNLVRRPAGCECASIIDELPEWFGRPDVNVAYAERAELGLAWVAELDDRAVGLMILSDTGFSALDIHFLAVRPRAHRQGVGRALVGRALGEARALERPYLTVKTLGPSHGSEPYAQTRAFYRAVGFDPLEEFAAFWGPDTPCLLMVMAVPDERVG